MTSRSIYVAADSDAGRLIAGMRASEEKEIQAANTRLAEQITTSFAEVKGLEDQVKALANVVARLFVRKRDWMHACPPRLEELIEPTVTKLWLAIRTQITLEKRKEKLDRCITGASPRMIHDFYEYADRLLPTV